MDSKFCGVVQDRSTFLFRIFFKIKKSVVDISFTLRRWKSRQAEIAGNRGIGEKYILFLWKQVRPFALCVSGQWFLRTRLSKIFTQQQKQVSSIAMRICLCQ